MFTLHDAHRKNIGDGYTGQDSREYQYNRKEFCDTV
jgi:hypothetical protein